MSITLTNYLANLQKALDIALCVRDFASMKVEKHNKPEVEMLQFSSKKTNDINLNPIYLARSEGEYCLIEPSINSVRVSYF
jgi:actin related protein 2/3 complex subunit 4